MSNPSDLTASGSLKLVSVVQNAAADFAQREEALRTEYATKKFQLERKHRHVQEDVSTTLEEKVERIRGKHTAWEELIHDNQLDLANVTIIDPNLPQNAEEKARLSKYGDVFFEVYNRMKEHDLRAIPIVDDTNKVVKACIKELGLDEKQLAPRMVRGAISSAKNHPS